MHIITQNIDNLHEQAGSAVLHLHGELMKALTGDETLVYELIRQIDILPGDLVRKDSSCYLLSSGLASQSP